ncbi:MAG TPA: DEAD/DEAH box helicase [Candidatus Limnocylindrales bacterium]|nr:DEAD/DEAH box helicase [Candidatus Limnocylindrales bacterium]
MPASARSTQSAFATLGLDESLVTAVVGLGYEEPTPVQAQCIPLLLSGKDLLAQAATGTGKTAAFALPMLQNVRAAAPVSGAAARKAGKAGAARTRGIVLVPTRELAMQVSEAIYKYARGTDLTVVPLYGGAPMPQQIRALDRGADIVVATPGRALDHLRRRTLGLEAIGIVVLDEADEMLDMGFAEDIDAILETAPQTRQTALFSATMPPRLRAIAERHLREPERITIEREKPAGKVPRVRQVAYVVTRAHKEAALQRVLDVESAESALVFCRTRLEVDSLVETLGAHGYRTEALHGGMQQRQREAVMARFRAAKLDLLVATDVAARGLDIQHLSHVFNYDVPCNPEAYIHRIGRTGRAGRSGTAITLIEPREHHLLRSIERVTKQKIEVEPLPTVADLRARRLEATAAAVREQLEQGNLDDVRVVVQSLAEEFDILDVAAAAVRMAHASLGGDREDHEIPAAAPREQRGRDGRREPRRAKAYVDEHEQFEVARLWVGAGRSAGIRPADLVGAITNEAGITSRDIGSIEIADRFSLVEVPDALADDIVHSMKRATLRGKKVLVRREREE